MAHLSINHMFCWQNHHKNGALRGRFRGLHRMRRCLPNRPRVGLATDSPGAAAGDGRDWLVRARVWHGLTMSFTFVNLPGWLKMIVTSFRKRLWTVHNLFFSKQISWFGVLGDTSATCCAVFLFFLQHLLTKHYKTVVINRLTTFCGDVVCLFIHKNTRLRWKG